MNRTGNKMHLKNTGNKHVNLIKLAHYFINDSKASCYFIAQLFILERFFTNDHIQKKKINCITRHNQTVIRFSLKLCNRPPQTLVESDSTICCTYTVCPPEDERLRLETYRGT